MSAPAANTECVRVRDVVRNTTHRLPRECSMLRVPYELFRPTGVVRVHDGLATYSARGDVGTGRVAAGALSDAQPGERVLVQLPPSIEGEWWLCEIEEANGVAAS